MSGIFSRLAAPRAAEQAAGTARNAADMLLQFRRADRETKDKLAALCQRWRREGGERYAAELEAAMNWVPAGDPLTGCLPVTAESPRQGPTAGS